MDDPAVSLRARVAEKIEPSDYLGRKAYPASARLRDGTWIDRVVFMTADWPWRHHAWTQIDARDVVEIQESEFRLPPRFVRHIQENAQNWKDSGWARLVFRDGTHQDVEFSWMGPIDFLFYPPGKNSSDLTDVIVDRDQVGSFQDIQWLTDIPTCWVGINKEAQQAGHGDAEPAT